MMNISSLTTRAKTACQAQRRAAKRRVTFFSLPGEIRNVIYRLALSQQPTIGVYAKQLEWLSRGGPGLLRVGARVSRECRRIYFEENVFCFTNESLNQESLANFFRAVGESADNLRRLRVRREYWIGDMKRPIVICFTAVVRTRIDAGRRLSKVIVVRPMTEKKVFPGLPGIARLRGKYQEPCRCEVAEIAHKCNELSRRSPIPPGRLLKAFLSGYIERVGRLAQRSDSTFKICGKCNSVMRT